MSQRFLALAEYFSNIRAWIVAISSALFFLSIEFLFTDIMSIGANFGLSFLITHIVLQIILAVLFGINLGVLVERLLLAQQIQGKTLGIGTIGAFLGLLVSGCAACGITLASFLGLASIVAALPFYGIEIKIAGIVLLLYATYKLLEPIACKIPTRRSQKRS